MTVNEEEFDEILIKINDLATKTEVNQEGDIRAERVESEAFLSRAQNAAVSLKNFTDSFNKALEEFNTEKEKSSMSLIAFDDLQDNLRSYSVWSVYTQANTTAIKDSVKSVENAIEELRRSVKLDSDGKIVKSSNNKAKQESLKSKVKESEVTLARTKKVRICLLLLIYFAG